MASVTDAHRLRPVHPGTAHKGRGRMAKMAVQCRIQVRRHGIRHALGGVAIVTGRATVRDARMVEGGALECGAYAMTNAAILDRYDMRSRFRRRESGVMT